MEKLLGVMDIIYREGLEIPRFLRGFIVGTDPTEMKVLMDWWYETKLAQLKSDCGCLTKVYVLIDIVRMAALNESPVFQPEDDIRLLFETSEQWTTSGTTSASSLAFQDQMWKLMEGEA